MHSNMYVRTGSAYYESGTGVRVHANTTVTVPDCVVCVGPTATHDTGDTRLGVTGFKGVSVTREVGRTCTQLYRIRRTPGSKVFA